MFHEKLRQLRRKEQMTQQGLADALGLDRTTVTKYESGLTIPPAESIKKICGVFKVSMDYMMDTQIETESHIELDRRVLLLQRAAVENNLNDAELQDIIDYAKYRYPNRFKGISDNEDNKV